MEWLCERCGEVHERNDPPCDACGHDRLEEAYVRRTDLGGDGTTLEWVCEDCGRSHPKHSPPCSRCGSMSLAKREVGVEPSDVSSPSYLALASRWQIALFAVAVLGASVLGLGVLGVADVPGLDGGLGDPAVPDAPHAPGNATSVYGTSASTVEADYLASVNEERERHDEARLRRTDDLDDLATYHTRWVVRAEHGGGEIPMGEVEDVLRSRCSPDAVTLAYELSPLTFLGNESNGAGIAEAVLEERDDLATSSATRTGLDVHTGPDGSVFVTQFAC